MLDFNQLSYIHCSYDYQHPFYTQVTPILTGTLFPLHLPTLTAMPHLIHRISLLVIISHFFLLRHLALAEELVLINDYYSVCEL